MKLILFFGIMLFSYQSEAALDEAVISTEGKTCSVHYLTTKTKFNWTIKVDPKNCQDGLVNGYTSVQFYSPRKELTETLTGFFNQGYWTADFPATGRLIERSSPEENVQTLSFLLGKDEEANITYIGQLRAHREENRSYGAFLGCPDFRVLVVVSDPKVFQNQAFQDKIVNQGLKYAHQYCAKLDVMALFGATSEKDPEIIFQMQVDTVTGDRYIVPLPEKKPPQKNTLPSEIREEKTDFLLSVKPDAEKTKVSYTHNSSLQIPKLSPLKIKEEKESLNHLQILSKISKSPVDGRAVVHIQKVLLDGTGITDLPTEVQLLYYPNLKPGWAVIEGSMNNNKIQVSNIQFCEQEWCQDVP